jgi:hypothetical protein
MLPLVSLKSLIVFCFLFSIQSVAHGSEAVSLSDLSASVRSSKKSSKKKEECPLFSQGLRFLSHAVNHPLEFFVEGELSPLWSQELVGTDLALLHLGEMKEKFPHQYLDDVSIGVIDTGISPLRLPLSRLGEGIQNCLSETYEVRCWELFWNEFTFPSLSHGTLVTNLIVGPHPIGGAFQGKITRLFSVQQADKDYHLGLEQMARLGPGRPRLVNLSLHPPRVARRGDGEARIRSSLQALSEQAILVVAAGNRFPLETDEIFDGIKAVHVGSLAPNGLVSFFSQEGEKVHIYVPSDRFQLSYDGARNGSFETLGATSGATAVVTAAISNLLLIFPNFTFEEIEVLLLRTALSVHPNLFSLNMLKLLRVAERLRGKSQYERQIHLLKSDLYDFQDDARWLYRHYSGDFASDSCEVRQKAVLNLRSAVFLWPDNLDFRKELANLYRNHGYEAEAQFFENKPVHHKVASLKVPLDRFRSWLRLGDFQKALEEWNKVKESSSEREKLQALAFASMLIGREAQVFFNFEMDETFLRSFLVELQRFWRTGQLRENRLNEILKILSEIFEGEWSFYFHNFLMDIFGENAEVIPAELD